MKLSENQNELYNLINVAAIGFRNNGNLTDKNLAKAASDFNRNLHLNLSKEEIEDVINLYHSQHKILVNIGYALKEKNHTPWYMNAKAKQTQDYWKRYCSYLMNNKKFSENVLNALDANTDSIMDLLGNPQQSEGFSRKGLVVGDVQSGKTATYIGLVNKAIDAGYRVIIILTGVIEKLRAQTQGRVDEGVVGYDSDSLESGSKCIGVGDYDSLHSCSCYTTKKYDFNRKSAHRVKLASNQDPVIFILKKNKTVLELLYKWLVSNNLESNGTIGLPMLLIDDEADNASINTKKNPNETTAINGCIRDILNVFSKSNYVGYTATPYANIFIDPDTDDSMKREDLFPKHFIYVLDPPSNYVGSMQIFTGRTTDFDVDENEKFKRGQYNFMLHNNDDCEDYLPVNHKKDFDFVELPDSLKEAIAAFFIANVIRDLRGDETTHRTMLVNISRFIRVQDDITKLIDAYVRQLTRVIDNYAMLSVDEALQHEEISFLCYVFNHYYANLPDDGTSNEKKYLWEDIQHHLSTSVKAIVVRSVNGGNASNSLDYDKYDDIGKRLIAVGGFSLSRGLTLEGLIISYYYRNSKMYDTLMQMGRWFGYRDGYADLCQIWMSTESQDWYSYIANATNELKKRLKQMIDLDRTPEDFGLLVRSDHASILVTASNKMRTASDHTILISLSKAVVETKYIKIDKSIAENNFVIVCDWVKKLFNDGYQFWDDVNRKLSSPYQIKNVDYKRVIELLSRFDVSYLNTTFIPETLVGYINGLKNICPKWDILIAKGRSNNSVQFGEHQVNLVRRSFAFKQKNQIAQIAGASAHLGSRDAYECGLTKTEYSLIAAKVRATRDEEDKDKDLNQEDFFIRTDGMPMRNPVLVIWPLDLCSIARDPSKEVPSEITSFIKEHKAFVGLSIGYPELMEKDERANRAEYKINKRYAESLEIDSKDDDYSEETGLEE